MLSGKQKSYLRGFANDMQPIIQIGKLGINDALVETIHKALEARELIKISVLQNCLDEPKNIAGELAEQASAEVVQVIGRAIVLYKASSNPENRDYSLSIKNT